MDTKDRLEKEGTLRGKVLFIFGILMALIYLSIGIVCVLVPEFLSDYHKNIKIGIGSIFIVYSFFRFYRIAIRYKKLNEY